MIARLGRLELLIGRTVKFYPKPVVECFDNPYRISQDYYGWVWSRRVYWLRCELGITWLA